MSCFTFGRRDVLLQHLQQEGIHADVTCRQYDLTSMQLLLSFERQITLNQTHLVDVGQDSSVGQSDLPILDTNV